MKISYSLILTDNGSQFKNPQSLELSLGGEQRTRIFYCHPNCSWHKPGVERSRVKIRRILPKGTSFKNQTRQQVFDVRDHISSLIK